MGLCTVYDLSGEPKAVTQAPGELIPLSVTGRIPNSLCSLTFLLSSLTCIQKSFYHVVLSERRRVKTMRNAELRPVARYSAFCIAPIQNQSLEQKGGSPASVSLG